jgi:putative ABC transport system permease protein
MFSNFFKTSFRVHWKNRGYSFLNIFGLTIGIACAGLIFLWAEDEIKFDHVNIKKERLFVVLNNWPFSGNYSTYESTPGLLGPAMKAEILGIANACRVSETKSNFLFTIGGKSMYAQGNFADSSLFSMFTMPFVLGNPSTAFRELHSMVITEKTAKKFFGNDKNVLGKMVRVENKQDYIISGVIKDFPENTSIQFEWVAPFEVYYKENSWLSNWDSNGILNFAELGPSSDLRSVNRQLFAFIKKRVPATIVRSFLFGMKDWHLRWSFRDGKQTGGGRIESVRMFILIAWIILGLACINFMNLVTARSEKRAREVGVRKVLGSGKKALIAQFTGEALLIAFLSVLLSVALMAIALPGFNILARKNLSLDLTEPLHGLSLLLIGLICGLVAGSYPSLYLSSFNPVFVLKGIKAKNRGVQFIRKGLVILQFTISIILIISTVIIFQQIQHVKGRDLGFNKNQLMVMHVQGEMGRKFNSIKQDLMNTGFVAGAALTSHETIYAGNNSYEYYWKGKDPNAKIIISQRDISPELLSISGIRIVQGRDFNPDPASDSLSIIISESLAKLMPGPSAISQIIRDDNTNYRVVGVAKDFIYGNMYGKPDPVIFFCQPHYEYASSMYIRVKDPSNIEKEIAAIEGVMKKDNPAYPFDYTFVDDEFNQLFQTEMLISHLSRLFAGLAILISCLGLFGLAAFTAERRTKEIGIRKVLGASVPGIAALLSFDFLKLVFISSVLAFPLGGWAMYQWLQNYAYRISISWWVFLAAGAAAILIAMLTIGFQASKAALMNPVRSLRNE